MHSDEDRQGSLFGGEAFRPPPPRRPIAPREDVAPDVTARTPREDVAPDVTARTPREDVAPDVTARTPREDVAPFAPPREDVAPLRDDAIVQPAFAAPPEAGEIRVSRGAATPLAGPTLDDVVTHAWEGLVAGVPAACPVCHGEIEPVLGGALRGHCGTCGVTLD
jgi:hypothetical protein